MNIAYRWFLGYTLNEELPHFSTVSCNFKHRFTEETVEQVFSWILQEANGAGYLEPEAVFVDGTHLKANANINKKIKKEVPQAAKRYASELMEEINADREAHGKKPFEDGDNSTEPKKRRDNTSKKKLARRKKEAKRKQITVSKTDPESGLFRKGEHKKCFAYEAHTACDKHNFVLDVEVTPGNVHDSVTQQPTARDTGNTKAGVISVKNAHPVLAAPRAGTVQKQCPGTFGKTMWNGRKMFGTRRNTKSKSGKKPLSVSSLTQK